MRFIVAIFFIFLLQVSALAQKIKTETEIRKDENTKELIKIETHFYKNGDKKLENFFVNNKKDSYRTFSEKKNNEVKEVKYNSYGAIKETVLLKYDDNGELISTEYQLGENGPKYIETYNITYDKKKNIINLIRLLGEEEKGWEYIYEYNKYNKKTKSISKFEGEIREEIDYVFDKKTKIEQKIYSYKNGLKELTESISFEYDKKGKLLKETHKYENENPVLVINYEYDKKGNVVSKNYFKDEKLDMKKEYSYTYY